MPATTARPRRQPNYSHPTLGGWSAISSPAPSLFPSLSRLLSLLPFSSHPTPLPPSSQPNPPPHPAHLQVLSLGAPRTATLSMAEAFTILGLPAYHYASLFAHVEDCDLWLSSLEAKYSLSSSPSPTRPTCPHHPKRHDQISRPTPFTNPNDWDALLQNTPALTDAPSILFWRELLTTYPDAKVILVERDPGRWLASMHTLVTGVLHPLGRHLLRHTDPLYAGRILNTGIAWISGWFSVPLRELSVEKVMDVAGQTYQRHYEEVRREVPRERLLEYELGQGWGPLCEFLGREVPRGTDGRVKEFPWRNDAEALERAFGVFLRRAAVRSVGNVVVIGVGVLGLWWVVSWWVLGR